MFVSAGNGTLKQRILSTCKNATLWWHCRFKRGFMKVVKVSKEFFDDCKKHNTYEELLESESGRPCVLIVKLKYRGRYHDFIVPLRSNISASTPDEQYFHLPPNPYTREGCSHGIHYIKLFPIHKKYIRKYRTDNDEYWELIKTKIDKNESEIISACQEYLNECEAGNKHYMTPNIDGILSWIYS